MSDAFCNKCGHRNSLGANFCSSCGEPIGPDASEPTTVTFHPGDSGLETDRGITIDPTDVPAGSALLVVTRGPNEGSRYLLDNELTTAGRHPDSEIFLDDVTVSRRHAELKRTDDGYLLRDVGSLNGTYLNRERIEGEALLENGDELQIGTFRLVFMLGGG